MDSVSQLTVMLVCYTAAFTLLCTEVFTMCLHPAPSNALEHSEIKKSEGCAKAILTHKLFLTHFLEDWSCATVVMTLTQLKNFSETLFCIKKHQTEKNMSPHQCFYKSFFVILDTLDTYFQLPNLQTSQQTNFLACQPMSVDLMKYCLYGF